MLLPGFVLQAVAVLASLASVQDAKPVGQDEVVLHVTVSLPEGDEPGLIPADLQIHVARIHPLTVHTFISTLGGPRRYRPSPPRPPRSGAARFVVHRGGSLGVTVFSPTHGLVEVTLADEFLGGHLGPLPIEVPITLPPRRAPGKVSIEMKFEYDRVERARELLTIRSGLTGVRLIRRRVPMGESRAEFELPPGEYRAHMIPSLRPSWNGVEYESPFELPPAVDLRQRFAVESGRTVVLQHTFERGARFVLRVDVAGHEDEIEESLAATITRTDYLLMLWRGFEVESDWVATASLCPIGNMERPTLRPVVTSWRADGLAPRAGFPLGLQVETVNRVAPGEYMLTIWGPRIETTSIPIVIEARADWRAPERVQRVLVQPVD